MGKGEFMPESFLKIKSSDSIVKVVEIKDNTVTVVFGSNQEPKEVSYDDLAPIPIKDIVSRLRLKSMPNVEISDKKLRDAFEYTHQLQALIYIIIGDEVTLKDS